MLVFRRIQKFLRKCTDREFIELFDSYDAYHAAHDTLSVPIAELLSDLVMPGASILDVGCGDGGISRYLVDRKGCFVKGIDQTKRAEQRGIPVELQDIDAGLEITDCYDYIIFSEVIEHLKFPHVALRKAAQHQRNGLLITIPNTGWVIWRIQLLLGQFPRQSFLHLHFWTHADFKLFCKKLGLRVVQADFLFFKGRNPLLDRLARWWPNLLAYQLVYRVVRDDQ